MDYLWSLKDAPPHARERIVPSGTLELVINLYEDEFRVRDVAGNERRVGGAMVSGCYAAAFEVDTRAHTSIVGVHFRVGGAARLLGTTAGSLADTHVSLAELWGSTASVLREQLCHARNASQRFELLEEALLMRWSRQPRCRAAVSAAIVVLACPSIEVGEVAKSVALSRRRLIEIFTEDVGMTPKRYAMVRRFQRALAQSTAHAPIDWAQIALQCGYFDQAHLCRDWTALTGLSPRAFAALRGIPVKENHVAVPVGGVKSVQDLHSLRR